MLYSVNWFWSFIASATRLGAGKGGVLRETKRSLPVLYEFEACPYCKIAREAISEAGISVLVRPCPKGGTRFRPAVADIGGKAQFPFLVDADTGEGNYESGAIAKQIRKEAGVSQPFVSLLGPLNIMLAQYSILVRWMAGLRSIPAIRNETPLEFSGIELHPAARLVKERLCSMELEYVWHTGKGETVRLSDPNTGDDLLGGRAILDYLDKTYRAVR